ncbi:MAG TPA: LptF/LptG family permease [Isosphaeraceae bacterium]|jgi:lipopolysaccharide export system permease protein|nr:LptF/LptG family permease [Isosphaeraceae bacterium]
MRILDRQRYWNFFKAYAVCFVTFIGLYIVIDAFANIDEFAKRAKGLQLLMVMGRYYLIRSSQIYDRLFGVITMMAAIFTVTWMQRSNELIAMLAAGIGTKRVIRPVIVGAVLVNGLAVANQECILPRFGDELLKNPDDDGSKLLPAYSRYDARDVLIHGKDGDRNARSITDFFADIPPALIGTRGDLRAKLGRYIPDDDPRAPLKGGWLLWGVDLSQFDGLDLTDVLERLKVAGQPEPVPPEGVDPAAQALKPKVPVVELSQAEIGRLPGPIGSPETVAALLQTPVYFFRTNVSFAAITRNRSQWYFFATTPTLIDALGDPTNKPERLDIAIFLHARLLRPFLSLALLLMSLPLVLGGDGRNMFINLGLSLGNSALFYATCFLAQYLASNFVFSPELAAWAPLVAFATYASSRWDSIRT